MAILDFNKKKEELKGMETSGSRFTLMIEDAFSAKKEKGMAVAGMLHGEVKVGDTAFIYHHTTQLRKVKVKSIGVGKGEKVESASNGPVEVIFEGVSSREQVPKYAVISSISPQTEVDVKKAVENPFLLGLSMEYGRHARDEQYLNTLIYATCHSNFITPVKLDKQPESNGDGTATFTSDTTINFCGVTHPAMPDVSVLPVFTDWGALAMWNGVFENDEKKQTMILRFPDAVSISRNGYSGMVINPFGPVPVFMPADLIDHITTLEGYRMEFGNQ